MDNTDNRLRPDGNVVCDICGKPGALQFGDRWVCEDCYVGCGSCCPEFGEGPESLQEQTE